MADIPEFHTAAFRKVRAELMAEIDRIKDEAVAFIDEAPHAHAERVGRIAGIRRSAELMIVIDKAIAGVE